MECVENVLATFRINAWPKITHRDQYAASLAPLGAEQQLAHALVDRAHRFHRVQDQVQHHLLQLNTIAVDSRQALGEAGLHRDPILDDCFAPSNRLADRLVEIETIIPRRRFLDVITNPVDDNSRAVGIADTAERFPAVPLGQCRTRRVNRPTSMGDG